MNWIKESFSDFDQKLDAVIHYKGISDKKATYILLAIIVFTAIIRLLIMDTPPLDRTEWKEIDYLAISSNYHENGYNFLKPEVSWPAEPPRVTAMELPVVPYLASLLYPVFEKNVYSVRFITFVAYLLMIFFTFKLVKREMGVVLALLTALFVSIFPLGNYYKVYLFSEPMMIFCSVFALYHYAQWTDFRKNSNLIFFIIGFSLAIALKPTSLYMALPLAWVHFRKYKWEIKKYGILFLLIGISMILPVAWYAYAYQIAQNSIDVFGVFGGQFGGHDKFQTVAMLSKIGWYIEMYARLRRMLLGNAGLLIMAFGFFTALYYKKGWLFIAYLLAIASFFIIVAEGNYDTHYRQLTIIPVASYFVAFGTIGLSIILYNLAVNVGHFNKKSAKVIATVICVVLLSIAPIFKSHRYIPRDSSIPSHQPEWELAQEIKEQAPEASKIIMMGAYTIHKGGNDLNPILYHYSGLTGWSLQEGQWDEKVIDELKNKGATLLGATYYKREAGLVKFLEELSKKYEVLYSNPEKQLLLISLVKEK
jgi:4-amino-4-deoxy-L-arabinose transferase-like glycosyltransferase